MDWEVKDFRNHPEPPEENWPVWTVPNYVVLDYLFKIVGFIFLLPWLFGVMLTPLGLFFNFLFVDWIIYRQYKRGNIIK